MPTRRSLLLLPGALATSACQPRSLDVEFDGEAENVDISAFSGGAFGFFRSPASIHSVTVFAKDSDELIWGIRPTASCAATLHKVRYGVVPQGFEQLTEPQVLREDVNYSVWIIDCGGVTGGGYFAILDGRVATVAFLVERQ